MGCQPPSGPPFAASLGWLWSDYYQQKIKEAPTNLPPSTCPFWCLPVCHLSGWFFCYAATWRTEIHYRKSTLWVQTNTGGLWLPHDLFRCHLSSHLLSIGLSQIWPPYHEVRVHLPTTRMGVLWAGVHYVPWYPFLGMSRTGLGCWEGLADCFFLNRRHDWHSMGQCMKNTCPGRFCPHFTWSSPRAFRMGSIWCGWLRALLCWGGLTTPWIQDFDSRGTFSAIWRFYIYSSYYCL